MIFRMFTRAAVFAIAAVALPASAQTPGLERVLSAVTSYFSGEGGYDLAILVDNLDDGADLYIYLDLDRNKLDAATKPALVKKNAAWTGSMAGTRPSLAVNDKGSLLIKSSNKSIGRSRWSQTLTVVYRNKTFIVAGLTHDERDTLDLKAGGSCDLNFLTGKGLRNGKRVEIKPETITLADWSDEKLPKECKF